MNITEQETAEIPLKHSPADPTPGPDYATPLSTNPDGGAQPLVDDRVSDGRADSTFRIVLKLVRPWIVRIDRIGKLLGAPSRPETLRAAFRTYEMLVDAEQQGKHIAIVDPNTGSMVKVKML